MEEEKNPDYISLIDAAKLCSYSEPYLRLRARQGKLKSIKLGKKWMTTSGWIADYERRVAEWRESSEAKKVFVQIEPPKEVAAVLASLSAPAAVDKNIVLPPVAARRKLSRPGGQVLPLPRERSSSKAAIDCGWIGPLLAGALAAVALFLAANPQGFRAIKIDIDSIGQASLRQAVEWRGAARAAIGSDRVGLLPIFGNGSLNGLVDEIDGLFDF